MGNLQVGISYIKNINLNNSMRWNISNLWFDFKYEYVMIWS